ncbi:MAG TPA: CerR family C-terminal domain-containing protein [Acidisarcina sp.]
MEDNPQIATPTGPPERRQPIEPRTRVLDAALELFGEHGFAETSIRDIASAAGVNLAAVNYYYGSKENLRLEALRHGFAPTAAMAGQLGTLYEDARTRGTLPAAEQALRLYIHVFLSQILGADQRHWAMVLREQLTPGPAFEMVMHDYLEPLGVGLAGIVGLLLPSSPASTRGLCVRSIFGQCVHLRLALGIVRYFEARDRSPDARPHARPHHDGSARTAQQRFIDESSDHIAMFSIQALRGIRRDSRAPQARQPARSSSLRPRRKGGR